MKLYLLPWRKTQSGSFLHLQPYYSLFKKQVAGWWAGYLTYENHMAAHDLIGDSIHTRGILLLEPLDSPDTTVLAEFCVTSWTSLSAISKIIFWPVKSPDCVDYFCKCSVLTFPRDNHTFSYSIEWDIRNDEMTRMWQEVVMAYFKELSKYFPVKTQKSHCTPVCVIGLWAKIQIRYHPSMEWGTNCCNAVFSVTDLKWQCSVQWIEEFLLITGQIFSATFYCTAT